MKKQFFLIAILFSCLSLSLSAQKGAISGTIVDENSGEPLIGATVVIENTTIGTSTDFDGKYQFSADPGIYTISIDYLGYNSKKITEVEIKANETTYLDASLSDEAVELDLDVVVTAKVIERSENAVLLLQKKSDKIQDGISSQEISRLGASSAAAALTKVTGTTIVDGKYVYVRGLGDRYSSTSLNGTRLPSVDPYRNSAQLDLIPTNLLDNIIASKTFTPDLPGDFTGGYVDIKIKTLPERFTYGFSVSTTYNTQSSFIDNFLDFNAGNSSWLGFNDGTLDAPASLDNPRLKELNVLDRAASASARRDEEVAGLLDGVANDFNRQFTPTTTNTPLDYNLSFNLGNQFKLGNMPVGVLLTMNYSNEYSHYDNALQANYVNTGGTTTTLQQNFSLRDTKSEQAPSLGGLFGLSLRPSPNNEISFYTLYSHQAFQTARTLEGSYRSFGISEPNKIFYSNTLGFLERELLDYVVNGEHVIPGANNLKIEWAASYVESSQQEPDLRFFANQYEPGRDLYAIATSLYLTPGHYYRNLEDQSFEGKVDITIPFLQNANSANKIKIGGLYSTKTRNFAENIYNVFNAQGAQFSGDAGNYFSPGNTGVIGQRDNGQNIIGLYISDDTNLANIYEGNADIWATYGMLTYAFNDRFKFIGGARLEATDFSVVSEAAAVNPNPELFKGAIDEMDILPAANFVYSLTENANLRASYSNTLARPNMREIAPFGSFGFIGDPPVFGNPDLTRSRVNNIDLRYELYMKPGELFAVSGFYKLFKDPIVRTFRPAGNPQFTWVNTTDANLFGGEIEFRKSLDFIAPSLQNLSFSGNLAIIFSEVALDPIELEKNRDVDPDFPATRPFAGQSPLVANANLNYTNRDAGWDAILAFNYFGDRLFTTGVEGTPDLYERGRPQLDLSVSKKFGNFQLKLRARNILNPDYETYSEFNGEEYIYSRYQRGREVSLGVSFGI